MYVLQLGILVHILHDNYPKCLNSILLTVCPSVHLPVQLIRIGSLIFFMIKVK